VPELRRTRQKAKFAFWGFSEVRFKRILGSCLRDCNLSYLSSMRNTAGLQVSEETRLPRFHILVASPGCREGDSVG
jgi:hypothetical protein